MDISNENSRIAKAFRLKTLRKCEIAEQKCLLLYSLLNKKSWRNFYSKYTFFRQIEIKMIRKTFALPRDRKSFADHFDFQFDEKFRQIDEKIVWLQNNFCWFAEFLCEIIRFLI